MGRSKAYLARIKAQSEAKSDLERRSEDDERSNVEAVLIHGLVEGMSLRQAAKAVPMAYTSAWRMTQRPEFQAQYRAVLRTQFIAVTQRAVTQAPSVLSALIKIVRRGGSNSQLGAAKQLMELMQMGLKLDEQELRLREIEKAQGKRARGT